MSTVLLNVRTFKKLNSVSYFPFQANKNISRTFLQIENWHFGCLTPLKVLWYPLNDEIRPYPYYILITSYYYVIEAKQTSVKS